MSDWVDPAPKEMGWGQVDLGLDQNRLVEAKLQNELPVLCSAGETAGASAIIPSIEQTIRSKFKFDEGWDFMVAERMVYKLGDTETLMIPQNMGNCVGDSHCCLLASRIAHEILAEGDPEDPLGYGDLAVPFIPYSYGVGRWVGDMLGPGDGSYCGAQIEGTMKYGFLPCFTTGLKEAYGDLPQSSTSVGRLFGRSKSEISKWTDKAAQFDLLEAPKCESAEDLKTLIVNKKVPIQICSGWGFAYDGFDNKYGVHLYRKSGSWSHSMQLVACFAIKGQWFTVIRNQWGQDQHKGSPEIGIPGGCMVITIELFERWVQSAEAIGIGAIKGLPANPGF